MSGQLPRSMREAADLLQPLAGQEEPDPDVLISLGMALARIGRRPAGWTARLSCRFALRLARIDMASITLIAG